MPSVRVMRVKLQFSIVFKCSPEPSKEYEEVTDAHALVDKVPSGSTGLTECWSPTRWTGSHGIAPEVWIKMCELI